MMSGSGLSLRARVRHPPLWVRWVLALAVAAAMVAFFVALNGGGSEAGPSGASQVSAEREANRESRIIVTQDQAPHTITLRRGIASRRTLERAIDADVQGRLRRHELSGAYRGSRCRATGDGRRGRRALRCRADVGDLSYPFLGVVDARRVTWCKRDPAPTPALGVRVSARCRA